MSTYFQDSKPIVKLDFQGYAISDRPFEVKSKRKKIAPFTSQVVTDLNPLGLPPIRREYEGTRPVKLNPIFLRNKRIVKKIEKLRKIEGDIIKEQEDEELLKYNRVKENLSKTNIEINKLRQKIYATSYDWIKSNDKGKLPRISQTAEEPQKAEEDGKGNSHQEQNTKELLEEAKNNPKYTSALNSDKLKDKEIDELVDFAQNLDYEKYIKDLEIREALNLIKLNVDKENEIEDFQRENQAEEPREGDKVACDTPEDLKDFELNKPTDHVIEHDKEWNVSLR